MLASATLRSFQRQFLWWAPSLAEAEEDLVFRSVIEAGIDFRGENMRGVQHGRLGDYNLIRFPMFMTERRAPVSIRNRVELPFFYGRGTVTESWRPIPS
jgi:hypothetical protein